MEINIDLFWGWGEYCGYIFWGWAFWKFGK